jgi:hypothetical protein
MSSAALFHFDCAGPGTRLPIVDNKTAAPGVSVGCKFFRRLDQLSRSRRRNAKSFRGVMHRGKPLANFDRLLHPI